SSTCSHWCAATTARCSSPCRRADFGEDAGRRSEWIGPRPWAVDAPISGALDDGTASGAWALLSQAPCGVEGRAHAHSIVARVVLSCYFQRMTSNATAPLSLVPVMIGGRRWRIWCVEDQDYLLSVASRLEHLPYGLLLWESSVGLSQRLAEEPSLVRGKRVLALGAGTGLPGLVARSLGASVWQTDHMEDVLDIAALNERENALAGIRRFRADWRDWVEPTSFDVILGADILY